MHAVNDARIMNVMLRTRIQTLALLVLVALAGGAWIHATRLPTNTLATTAAPRVNFAMPAFTLTALDGTTVASDDLRGKVLLVNFWATWCPPCRAEMPLLQSVYQAHRERGLVVVAIDVAENPATVAQFAQELGLTFPILLDQQVGVSTAFQVNALPTSFFVDRDGVIRASYMGALNRAYIEAQLTPLWEQRR